MKFSNLAQRLEDYGTDIQTLRSARPEGARLTVARGATENISKPARGKRRVGGIVMRDGGFKPFRVR
jgi:hypothetical protein